ncbi:MAG: hypothetical protein E7Z98_01025 [Olsenella sp.]|nr:hypothetical protein [Olsenella sp.]
MYSYESYQAVFWLFFFFGLIGWYYITSKFVDIAKEKGYADRSGTIWALSLFGTGVVAALYTIALPDKAGRPTDTLLVPTEDELPSL